MHQVKAKAMWAMFAEKSAFNLQIQIENFARKLDKITWVSDQPKDNTQIQTISAKPDLQLDGLESKSMLVDLKKKQFGQKAEGLLQGFEVDLDFTDLALAELMSNELDSLKVMDLTYLNCKQFGLDFSGKMDQFWKVDLLHLTR